MEWGVPSTSTVHPDEREFIFDSGASLHVFSKMAVSPEELETVKVSRLPPTVITADGSLDTTEEAMVCVQDLDMVVTVQLLEDPPAVLSLGKLCEENGYSHESIEGQAPNLCKNSEIVQMRQLRIRRRS